MRVVVEVFTNEKVVQRASLLPGERLRVGRGALVDLSIPHDRLMSSVHCELEVSVEACYLEDLGSTNGTEVKGVRICNKTRLRHGDRFRAGVTEFAVDVSGDASGEVIERPAPARAVPAEKMVSRRTLLRGSVGTCRSTVCPSGLTIYRGQAAQVTPSQLIWVLQQRLPVFLVAQRARLKSVWLPPPREENFVMDWLEKESRSYVSPELIAVEDIADVDSVLEEGWGDNSMWCWFSSQSQPSLLSRLRDAVSARLGNDDVSRGVLGIGFPQVVSLLLMNQSSELVCKLVQENEALLMESAGDADEWLLLAEAAFATTLEECGLEVEREPPSNGEAGSDQP